MGEAHGVSSSTRVSAETAHYVARLMGALATPSRVRILARLREGACTVGQLTDAVEMQQSAVSHQLRILRDLELVRGSRDGRHTVYELCDHHVAALLDETLRHIEHLRTGAGHMPAASDWTTDDQRRHMTDEHTHEEPHNHEHSHDETTHAHAHSGHDHEHVEHEHEHTHDDDSHAHTHVHEQGLEEAHEHDHA